MDSRISLQLGPLFRLWELLLAMCFAWRVHSQIADPVFPIYNLSLVPSLFSHYPVVDGSSVEELVRTKVLDHHNRICLSNTNTAVHCVNRVRGFPEEVSFPAYLPNNTYWFNEYLHVGHIHYDIVLMQLLATTSVDRIVLQRTGCFSTLCHGIGTIESFYKGYFAAVLEAFNQSHVPVYMRFTHRSREVDAYYFSAHTENFYYPDGSPPGHNPYPKIELQGLTCFDDVYRRAAPNYGATALLSPKTVQRFKQTAYNMLNKHYERFGGPAITGDRAFSYFNNRDLLRHSASANSVSSSGVGGHSIKPLTYQPLTEHFTGQPPYRILLAYRGIGSTRYISNLDTFVQSLATFFPAPTYEIALLDTSSGRLTFQEQLHAVASSYVVLSNHGAFEGNMIYMRNSSLLVEIFGHYGNNEIHTFHRLALVLGLYYARVHPRNMTDHQMKSFVLSTEDIEGTGNIIKEYFQRKAYQRNMLV